ncbi:MAG: hypothetical protein PQJ50_16120 [Spirochaetales bacterium]|nr:hypothetical protein [Spirochaetales bacterium]
MSADINSQKSRLVSYFGDDRHIDVLFGSLAKKLLKEGRENIPSEVLACISGVPEEDLKRLFSGQHSIINDLMNAPVQAVLEKLRELEISESSFLDKLTGIMRLIYNINRSYPEIMILFQGFAMNRRLDKKYGINKTMEQLVLRSLAILKHQAREEKIAETDSSMEMLLFFLIRQLMETMQNRVFEYCYLYIETGDVSCFPSEEDVVDSLLAPVRDQLAGLTAI